MTPTMQRQRRKFESVPAVRSKVPMLFGASGPSGSGKTFTMLRIATGIQRITGGDIQFIDTESGRALHYADRFKFKHVPFAAPFNPLSYLDAIEFCCERGPGPIIIDSMSHEHDGPGGVLEMHAAEVARIAGDDWKKAERVQMLCWQKPKAERRKLINALVQMNRCILFCFRAKEKIKMVKGQEPLQLGFVPIAGEEFIFELTASALLLPCAGGVPSWSSVEVGEKQMIKLPEQFRRHFGAKQSPLDESDGEFMARWAAGESVDPLAIARDRINAAETESALVTVWKSLSKSTQELLVADKDRRKAELSSHVPAAPTEPDPLVEDCEALINSIDMDWPGMADEVLARLEIRRSEVAGLSTKRLSGLMTELANYRSKVAAESEATS